MIRKEIEGDIARVLTDFEEGKATAEDLYDVLTLFPISYFLWFNETANLT